MSKYGTIRIEYCGLDGQILDSEVLGAPPYGGPVMVKPMEQKLMRAEVRSVQVLVVNRPDGLPDLQVTLFPGIRAYQPD